MTGRRRRERIVAREERSNELRETRRLFRARRPGRAGAIRGNEHLRHGLRGCARIDRARLGHLIKMSQQRGPRVVPVLRLSIAELLSGEERVGLGELVVVPREPLLRHESAVARIVEESRRNGFAVASRNRSNQGSHRVARDGHRDFPQRRAFVRLRGDEDARDDILGSVTVVTVSVVKLPVEPEVVHALEESVQHPKPVTPGDDVSRAGSADHVGAR